MHRKAEAIRKSFGGCGHFCRDTSRLNYISIVSRVMGTCAAWMQVRGGAAARGRRAGVLATAPVRQGTGNRGRRTPLWE